MYKSNRCIAQIKSWFADLGTLLFPQTCANCGCRLTRQEEHICTSCFVSLPFTYLNGRKGNPIERLFWGKFPVGRAHAWLKYQAGSESTGLIMRLKYGNRPQIGVFMGRIIAAELLQTDFFLGIDGLIAIPLHKKRLKERGYNQSYEIVRGIHEMTQIPILDDVVERVVPNVTQTKLHREARRENVVDIFSLIHPEKIAHKHVLLVDDVLTTGATLTSCAQELAKAEGVLVSVLTAFTVGSTVELHPNRYGDQCDG